MHSTTSQATRDARRQAHVGATRSALASQTATPATEAECRDLAHLREEEKLARDVYEALHARWDIPPFANIRGSEQAHMDMVALLLEHFGLADPVRDLPQGQFHTPAIQALHDELVAQGERSLEEAVRVGLLIEELDIADLRAAMLRTEKPEVRGVYAELERGSRNHLRAFDRWMRRLGTQYVPQHLSLSDFEFIAWSEHEPCDH